MEHFLIALEINVFQKLGDLLDKVPVIIGGISLVAITIMTAWTYYKVLMILLGQSGDAFIPLVKDFLIKAAVVALIVSSSSTYKSFVIDNIAGEDGVIEMLSAEISGTEHIFSNIGVTLENTVEALEFGTTSPEVLPDDDEPSVAGFFKWVGRSVWDSVDVTFGGALTYIVSFLKFMIIGVAVSYLAIMAFATVALNKIFAYVSLAVGPLFIFASCFNSTRSWFMSWLNTTLGYLLSYVTVSIVWSFMNGAMAGFFYTPNGKEVSWIAVFQCVIMCFIFAKIVIRIGDLTSSWFGTGNIADSTAGVIAYLGGRAGAQGTKAAAKGAESLYKRIASYKDSGSISGD